MEVEVLRIFYLCLNIQMNTLGRTTGHKVFYIRLTRNYDVK